MLKFPVLILRNFAPKQLFERSLLIRCDVAQVRYTAQTATSVRQIMQKNKPVVTTNAGGSPFMKWFLLVMPVTAFGLGCWQIQRLRWKQALIRKLKMKAAAPAVEFPQDLRLLEDLEFSPVKVRGEFLHDKEIVMGPRSLIEPDGSGQPSGSFLSDRSKSNGFLVVTPFKLSDRDLTIMVNRGWVPNALKDPSKRPQGQITGELELTGIVRLHENRPPFVPSNDLEKRQFFYRNLDELGTVLGAAPVWLDARGKRPLPDGWPEANQTRVTLRNEHMSYLFTWFSLSAFTAYMWVNKFGRKVPKKFCV